MAKFPDYPLLFSFYWKSIEQLSRSNEIHTTGCSVRFLPSHLVLMQTASCQIYLSGLQDYTCRGKSEETLAVMIVQVFAFLMWVENNRYLPCIWADFIQLDILEFIISRVFPPEDLSRFCLCERHLQILSYSTFRLYSCQWWQKFVVSVSGHSDPVLVQMSTFAVQTEKTTEWSYSTLGGISCTFNQKDLEV